MYNLSGDEKVCHYLDVKIHISINDFGMPDKVLEKIFTDGRNASKLTEHSVELLKNPITIGGNSAKLVYDDTDSAKDGRLIVKSTTEVSDLPISVRSLTRNGFKAQLSEFMGKGRKCTQDNLIHSISCYPFFVVVDITQYRKWKLFIIESNNLMACAINGRLTPSGWTPNRFYEHLERWGYSLKLKEIAA
jgi:hypothetical protein